MTAFPPLTDDVVRRYDTRGPRYTSYPTVPMWASELSATSLQEHLDRASSVPASEPLSLYVHLPFCAERCTFCGCNVVITKERARADRYLDYLERDLDLFAERLGPRRTLSQIHWGGGTPTFLDEEQLARLWSMITTRFIPRPDAEIAIEIDPVATYLSQLDLLHALGFNRISMGVQDFDGRVQRAVNRVQTFEQTRAMLEYARGLGFASVNFDMIYGLPHQTQESWTHTLGQVLELRPDRLAVYSFAFVPDLRPHQKRLAVLPMLGGTPKLELFRTAYETFTNAGYQAIGMDHFALPGDELAIAQKERRLTRNFQGYTVHPATDVIAFGVSAISDVQGMYAQNVQALAKYYAALDHHEFPLDRGMILSDDDLMRRAVINELMCNFYVDLGGSRISLLNQAEERLRKCAAEGLLDISGTEVELTALGRVFVRNVAMIFDRYLEGGAGGFSRTV